MSEGAGAVAQAAVDGDPDGVARLTAALDGAEPFDPPGRRRPPGADGQDQRAGAGEGSGAWHGNSVAPTPSPGVLGMGRPVRRALE